MYWYKTSIILALAIIMFSCDRKEVPPCMPPTVQCDSIVISVGEFSQYIEFERSDDIEWQMGESKMRDTDFRLLSSSTLGYRLSDFNDVIMLVLFLKKHITSADTIASDDILVIDVYHVTQEGAELTVLKRVSDQNLETVINLPYSDVISNDWSFQREILSEKQDVSVFTFKKEALDYRIIPWQNNKNFLLNLMTKEQQQAML